MKILFLTMYRVSDVYERNLYSDLMRYFSNQGHTVYIVTPVERRHKMHTCITGQNGMYLLKVATLNLQKTNVIEKGIGAIVLEYQFLRAIKKHFANIRFDLVLYSTPPITYTHIVNAIKRRDKAVTYLLLKDIFPQNAIDLGMMKQGSLLHRFFLRKEKALYRISDYIGCMSPANVSYLLKHNPGLDPAKVEVNPNSIETNAADAESPNKMHLRRELGLPEDKTLLIYGGNLGKPQGIDFLLKTIEACATLHDAFFIVAGSGTEFPSILRWFEINKPANARLLQEMPKSDFDRLIKACDIGLVFLDKRFTIPNYPSRLLYYLENRMPVISATDNNTDIGSISVENQYGFWVHSGDTEGMKENIAKLVQDKALAKQMGQNGFNFLINNYSVEHSYKTIMSHFEPTHLQARAELHLQSPC